MLKRFKVLLIVLMAFGVATTETKADEPLMDGVRSFICDGPEGAGDEPIVLLDTDTGWLIPKEPTLKVAKINDGWRISGQELGFLGYLKQPASGAWSFDLLSNRGYEKFDCIDISDSVSEVITVIKPLLNDSILENEKNAKLAARAAASYATAKLKRTEDELTVMTLALEAQRKKTEDTLTLLAAARIDVSKADVKAAENKVQIESLGKNLNTALARVAAEQKKLATANEKKAALAEVERKRLEEEAKDLRNQLDKCKQ